jgi:hypothetical protein
VDIPNKNAPKENSDTDSSLDVLPPKKGPATAIDDDDSDSGANLNDGNLSADEQRASLNSSKEEQPPSKKRKTSVKKKITKADKKQAKGRSKKAPSDEDEEELEILEESESDGEQSNVSEFDPDALESEESEASWDDEEEEDVKPKKRGRPRKLTATGGKQKKSARGRRRKKEESDDSEASWNSEEEEVKPKSKRGRPKRTTGVPRERRAAANLRKNASEDSWNSSEDDGEKASYRTPRGSKRRGRSAQLEDSSDEEEEEEDDGSPRRSTPSRRSASKALARISDNVKKDANVEEEEEQDEKFPMTRKRRKKKNDDDDDEFDPDAEDSPEEEEEVEEEDDLGDEDSSALSADDNDGAKKYKAVNVDAQMDNFLTADSSEDENAPNPSPMLNIKSTPRSRRRSPVKQDVDSFASSESEVDQDDAQQGPTLSSSPHMPACPSEIDAITMDPLPEKHLCYFSPDFQSRQCFALETLHKIALNSTLRGLDGKPTFLQPPHFRSPASDDFVDQIASRFGRSALDLTGDFYNRGLPNPDGYRLTIGANLADEETFQERLNDYISNLMGSQDIYCCPLCYIESHRRLEKRLNGEGEDESSDEEVEDDDPDEPNDDERGPIQLWHDPMTVLGFPDHEKYLLASRFCFTKIADVKRHLREVHHVDTKILDSNDLFARFKVRVGDGLLQRYIEKTARKGRTYQGDMRRYWNLGNNQTFVYLIHLMKRRTIGGDMAGEADSQAFFRSFENRAKHTWDVVSAPYHKATREEVDDFIENEDVEEEDVQSHFAMHREIVNPADEIAEALKQRRLSQGGQLDSDDSSDDEEENESQATSDEHDANPDDIPGYYSEEEEEDDDWVKSRLPRPGRQNKVSPLTSNDLKPAAKGKRLGKARGKTSQDERSKRDFESHDSNPPPAKKAKRSRLIIESDSDE